MGRPQISLRAFRLLVRLLLFAAVASVTFGIYYGFHAQWGLSLMGIGLGIIFLYVSQVLTIRPEPGAEDELVFVTKKECALCDEARLLLPAITADTPFHVREVALDEDRFLRRHFRHAVPVLLWQGEELARLGWDADALRARLHQLLAQRSSPPPAENQGQGP